MLGYRGLHGPQVFVLRRHFSWRFVLPATPVPIVILGTGRSFTSVISCMIGQHPDMVGLPETNIFRDATLGALWDRFETGVNRLRRAGLLRTLAQFHDGAQTEETIAKAEAFIQAHRDWTYLEIAHHLVEIAAPKGIVEKSISTCREAETLERVRDAWPEARFLHVTRHPEAILKSMESRIDKAMEKIKGKRFLRMTESYSPNDSYNLFSSTILTFMAKLPPGQGMNIRGEDFLTDARLYCRQICEWVGLSSDDAAIEEMMHPERNPFAFTGPEGAKGGLSSTFLENPTYSGKPVTVAPMTVSPDDEGLDPSRRMMVLLGNRLGYA
jgi:hypothetical protein